MTVRIHVASALCAGEALALPEAAARHVRVLRLQPGSPLVLFNGADGAEWQAAVSRMTKSEVEVRVGEPIAVDRELPVAVTLALGAPANDRMDAFVEKACELGAGAIQPLLCERSVLRLAGERGEAKRRHWSGIAASASEQCGRTRVAAVAAMMPIHDWLGDLAAPGDGERRVVLSFAADAVSACAALADRGSNANGGVDRPRVVVLSGPEGGLTAAEEAAAVTHGFVRIGLGSRVLRADTAPLALLAWLGLAAPGGRP